MLNQDLSLLIHSCGAYSDLWDGQMTMLTQNWKNRDLDTYILTDTAPAEKVYPGVTILQAGAGTEITQRLQAFLQVCRTDYVLVTLDDYYLIREVSPKRISYLVETMKEQDLDYIRLFRLRSDGAPVPGLDRLWEMPIHEGKSKYYVNLYPGIWKRDFLEKTIGQPMNAWQYEVSLTPLAVALDARCLVDREPDYEILDVVRKGKLLHKANRYFQKNPGIYTGNRPVIPYRHEFKLAVYGLGKRLLPRNLQGKVKAGLKKLGVTFYSR